MVKRFIMEHIPRTLFAVKYNVKMSEETTYVNRYTLCPTKNSQDKMVNNLKNNPNYSEVKPIKWSLKV